MERGAADRRDTILVYPTLNPSNLSSKTWVQFYKLRLVHIILFSRILVRPIRKLRSTRVTHQNWSFFFENRDRDRDRDRIEIVTFRKIAQKIEDRLKKIDRRLFRSDLQH